MKPLVIIPARGGSKGVPGKNLKLLAGIPLIFHTINAARSVFPDDVICVSTDDDKIKSTVELGGLNVPFLRPSSLANDNSGSYEVILHAIDFYESQGYFPDTIVYLQPTSPFRTKEHIELALNLFNQDCEMLVSVKETKSNPYYVLFEENEDGWLEKSKNGTFIRRQDCPKVFEINGAIYLIKVDSLKQKTIGEFKEVRKFIMDEFSSHDIDTKFDWMIAEFLKKQEK